MTEQTELAPPVSSAKPKIRETKLRKLGFCGVDDSISPKLLGLICQSYPFVEFGVLFRPDKEGEPRYATADWVQVLGSVVSKSSGQMSLAAHLCGSRVNEILAGNDAFLSTLPALGFRRIQINATLVNGVDTFNLGASVPAVAAIISRHSDLEFILQKNEETRPLWEGILDGENCGPAGRLPHNVTMLVDESKGCGALPSSWPSPPEGYEIGYAGGIGPGNMKRVLKEIMEAGNGRAVWIDMESSLRSTKNGKDVFDINKCFECIEVVCASGMYDHPPFLT